jgi:hypothetical protein
VPVELLLKAPLAVLLSELIGTLNSRLHSVQTPTAGAVLSHLTTLRRRWIMGKSFLGTVETARPYRARVQIIAVRGLPLVWNTCAQSEHRMYRRS